MILCFLVTLKSTDRDDKWGYLLVTKSHAKAVTKKHIPQEHTASFRVKYNKNNFKLEESSTFSQYVNNFYYLKAVLSL